MARGLSDEFITDLKTGILAPILQRVIEDDTLDLQIRNNYINIYYRGGNIMKISEPIPRNGRYYANFNQDYFKGYNIVSSSVACLTTKTIRTVDDSVKWVNDFPILKQSMDIYFSEHRKEEREFQQLIGRENNWSSTSNDTDYFICDIEYANFPVKAAVNKAINTANKDISIDISSEILVETTEKAIDTIMDEEETKDVIKEAVSNGFRFDMAAVCWPSTKAGHQSKTGHRLALIEVKYGVNAVQGNNADLKKHLMDVSTFASKSDKVKIFKDEMLKVFEQKYDLGLIKSPDKLVSFSEDEKIDFIVVLINYKNASSKLNSAIDDMEKWINNQSSLRVDLKFAVSNYMGYGLYSDSVYALDDFKQLRK